MSAPGAVAAAPCAGVSAQRVRADASSADACAVIVAGGVGSRFGDPRGKQYLELCGLPMTCWSLMALDMAPSVGHIVVVCAPDKVREMRRDVLGRITLVHDVTLAPAGDTRQASVYSGLCAIPVDAGFDLVAIHDAARPLVSPGLVERCLSRVRGNADLAGAIAATRETDTLKLVEASSIIATPDRSYYWRAQTPQAFRLKAILAAHRQALRDEFVGTDDASLVERRGGRVSVVEAPADNIKVTLPKDLAVAEALLRQQLMERGCGLDQAGEGQVSGPDGRQG